MNDTATSSNLPDPRDAIIAQRDAKIAQLEARIAELEEIINRLRRGSRRQAAPFSKGLPKLNPKKPGRKSGDGYGTPPVCRVMPEPLASDQVIDVPPPQACLSCGSVQAVEDQVHQQVQRDIEVRTVVRRFVIRSVRCACCGKRRRGSHPLQTTTATGWGRKRGGVCSVSTLA